MAALDPRGVELQDFWQSARTLSREAFLAEYPHPFLLELTGSEGPSVQDFHTIHDATASQLKAADSVDEAVTPTSRVFGVCKTTSVFPGKVTVGRSKNNDIVVTQAAVSKLHAYFTQAGETWTLVDAESSNGTLHNGVRLESLGKAALANRDNVGFGRHARFVFVESGHLQRRARFLLQEGS